MVALNKELWRLAKNLCEQIAGSRLPSKHLEAIDNAWRELADLRRKIEVARQRGWNLAAESLTRELNWAADSLRRPLASFSEHLRADATSPQQATVAEIYRDLVALEEEFDDFRIDAEQHELCATTDHICLEDLELGQFKICLDWKQLGKSQPYRVEALNPNPPSGNSSVTHPHVSDETVCEGDGQGAIAAALREGRFFDFFLLVSRILSTYANGSAYVEIRNWDGTPCSYCGASLHEDSRYYCRRCECVLCDECSNSCSDCGDSRCNDCLTTCRACEELFCGTCLKPCDGCGNRTCENCLQDHRCPNCREETTDDDETADTSLDAATTPAIQSRGLGKAAVPA